jgi:hypothetical protein
MSKTKDIKIVNGIEIIDNGKIFNSFNILRFKAHKFWSSISPKLEKPFSFLKWLLLKVVFIITFCFVMLGIALVMGFYSHIITFNQRIITNNAVILYRSKLPAKLTKKESKEWDQILILQKKINKKSKAYQVLYEKLQDKKLFQPPKKR